MPAAAESEIIVSCDEACAYKGFTDTFGGTDSSGRYNHVPGGVNALYMDGQSFAAGAGGSIGLLRLVARVTGIVYLPFAWIWEYATIFLGAV